MTQLLVLMKHHVFPNHSNVGVGFGGFFCLVGGFLAWFVFCKPTLINEWLFNNVFFTKVLGNQK